MDDIIQIILAAVIMIFAGVIQSEKQKKKVKKIPTNSERDDYGQPIQGDSAPYDKQTVNSNEDGNFLHGQTENFPKNEENKIFSYEDDWSYDLEKNAKKNALNINENTNKEEDTSAEISLNKEEVRKMVIYSEIFKRPNY